MLHKMLGRLTSIAPVFKARADKQDPSSVAKSEVVNKLITALDEKLDQPSRTWELLWWMAIGGVAFEYVPWVKDASMEPLPRFDSETNELQWTDVISSDEISESERQERLAQGAPQEQFVIIEDMVLADPCVEVAREDAYAAVRELMHAAHVKELRRPLVSVFLATARLRMHIRERPVPPPGSHEMSALLRRGEAIRCSFLGRAPRGNDVEILFRVPSSPPNAPSSPLHAQL